jgi:hypothetical protein
VDAHKNTGLAGGEKDPSNADDAGDSILTFLDHLQRVHAGNQASIDAAQSFNFGDSSASDGTDEGRVR